MSITRRVAVGGLAALPFVQSKAQAQQPFPSKPCTFIVPFPAGGPADIFGRNLAERMSPLLGQPVLVENKSGAAGVTGVDFVAKAGTDAHVMGLMSASAGAIMQSLMPKMPYDPAKDIAGIVINRWGHARVVQPPGFFLGKDGKPSPLKVVAKGYGRVIIAHSELNGAQNARGAFEHGARAAKEAAALT